MRCEIILTGNELLIGKTKDTNGFWTLRQLTPLGVRFTQISVIQDDLNAIATTLQAAIARNPDYIFVSGGLGPTFDDMTLKGIHLGLTGNTQVEVNRDAESWILARYQARYPNVPLKELYRKYPYIRKMASMPHKGIPLRNYAGTAPGAYIPPDLPTRKAIIISMPGIPSEYEAMFTRYVFPEIQKKLHDARYLECGFTFQNMPESGFANKIYAIKDNYPSLWFKTHPHRNQDSKWLIELHISTFDADDSIIPQIREVYSMLKSFVEQHGGIILKEHSLS